MTHDYCCCAIPIVNFGIYLTIAEQLLLGILAGTLAVAAPKVVGAVLPSYASVILGVLCYVVAGAQILGFLGVFKEKAGLFAKYVLINSLATLAAFSIAAALIIISATRHNTAVSSCETDFFTLANSTTSPSDNGEGKTVCDIFTWTDIGLMGGMWIVFVIFQGYLILVTRFYKNSQEADHLKYYSLYSPSGGDGANGDNILLSERTPRVEQTDPWDARGSNDSWAGQPPTTAHYRTPSHIPMVAEEKSYPAQPGFDSAYSTPSAEPVGLSYPSQAAPERSASNAQHYYGSNEQQPQGAHAQYQSEPGKHTRAFSSQCSQSS
ncbi:hypothetical protein BOTBODRAFT_101812 [Botryobasidium botryosum FD-172 SS1]|uniref:Uncharacterized protein n=1 Tax=Botryobasidium botryosum (strain FD-172 SS1) TaxID=930990 RepID=A0A067MX16_BOTB1|nr:hypothetical protein BOTBODRAFT_101812 [Botryobasidium botryosum FD-172 SS1]